MSDRFPCPCCGYRTLHELSAYEICPVCFWEDDGAPPAEVSGPNGISLLEGQLRFLTTGAVHPEDRARTRSARREESRDESWQPLAQDGLVDRDVDDTIAAYNAARAALGEVAPTLSYAEVLARYRSLTTKHGFAFPEPELELLAHLLHDRHWRLRHPVQAIGWAWRHRRTASLGRRLRQLWTGTVRFAG